MSIDNGKANLGVGSPQAHAHCESRKTAQEANLQPYLIRCIFIHGHIAGRGHAPWIGTQNSGGPTTLGDRYHKWVSTQNNPARARPGCHET